MNKQPDIVQMFERQMQEERMMQDTLLYFISKYGEQESLTRRTFTLSYEKMKALLGDCADIGMMMELKVDPSNRERIIGLFTVDKASIIKAEMAFEESSRGNA